MSIRDPLFKVLTEGIEPEPLTDADMESLLSAVQVRGGLDDEESIQALREIRRCRDRIKELEAELAQDPLTRALSVFEKRLAALEERSRHEDTLRAEQNERR